LSFGQPVKGIMQVAYVVPDLRAAIAEWVETLNVGPWFVLDNYRVQNHLYRGKPTDAGFSIALSFAGHMNIELIQALDDHPSVYKEHIESRGYGFHHWGVVTPDFDRDRERYLAKGMAIAMSMNITGAGRVVFFDSHGKLPGFIEMIEAHPVMERIWASFYGASRSWDGANPIRKVG
jgi:hypothetical protein